MRRVVLVLVFVLLVTAAPAKKRTKAHHHKKKVAKPQVDQPLEAVLAEPPKASLTTPVVEEPKPHVPTVNERLAPGKKVILQDLQNEQYNGIRGRVVGMKAGTNRFEVELDNAEKKHIAVHSINLKVDLTPETLRNDLAASAQPFKDLTDDDLRQALQQLRQPKQKEAGSLAGKFPLSSHVVLTNFARRANLPDLNQREGVVVGYKPDTSSVIVRLDGKGPDVDARAAEVAMYQDIKQRTVHNTHATPDEAPPATDPATAAAAVEGHGVPHRPVVQSPLLSGLMHSTMGRWIDPKPANAGEDAKHRIFLEQTAKPGTKVVVRSTREKGLVQERHGSDYVIKLPSGQLKTVVPENLEVYSQLLAYLNDE